MDPELAALASSAATALIAAWTTDTWTSVKERLSRLLGRGDDMRTAAADAELVALRGSLVRAVESGEPARVAEAERQWHRRLTDLLRDEPAAAADLRAVLDELEGQAASGERRFAGDHVEIHGNTFHGPVQVKGIQHNHG